MHEGVPDELQAECAGCAELRILKLGVEGFEGQRQGLRQGLRPDMAVPAVPQDSFCVLFTGGTFRSRCVVVSHAMVEHESAVYSECVKIDFPLRITAHTSVYWGASALGQMSIALAFGGCAVLCEVADIEDFKAVLREEQVNAIGLVPDQLKLLAEDPIKELPKIQVVFSWGEKLPMNVARRWAKHGASLRELLVSTEYWLSFWSAPLEGLGRHRIVSGVEAVVVDDGELAEVGELLIRGPMVTPGYLACSESPFIEFQGKTYYRTRDLVRKWPDGSLEFRGRADLTMKQRGQWVDLFGLQSKLEALEGVEESALLPCPEGGATIHIFLVLKAASNAEDVAEVIRGARRLIDGEVHTLSTLPRHPVTQKVDVRALKALVKRNQETWPLNVAASPDEVSQKRGGEKVREIFLWTGVALLAGLSCDLQSLKRSFLGIFMLPYMHLSFLHAVDESTLLGRFMSAAAEKMPMGIWGTMFLTLLSRSLSSLLRDRLRPRGLKELVCAWNIVSKMSLGVWLTHGVLKGWQRGRLFQYVVVFWSGIGHRLQYDLERWCTWRYWRWYVEAFFTPLEETQPRERPEVQREAQAEESLRCSTCCRSMETAWPPPVIPEKFALIRQPTKVFGSKDRAGDPICWGCWVPSSIAACKEGHELAKSLLTENEGGEEDQEQVEEPTWSEWARQAPKNKDEKWQHDNWWWRNKTVDYVDLKASFREEKLECRAEVSDPKLRQIYKVLRDILRADVRDDLPFHSLDSLALGLLVGRLRAEFGVSLSISQLRNASPQDLPQLIQEAASVDRSAVSQEDEEYAVWFSPGQYFPMGGWVLRKDGEIDCERMKESAAQVVKRHAALRAVPSDPLRLLSFVLDTAVMFTLAARLLDRTPFTRQLRRLVSWALKHSWSRIAIKKPDIYPNSNPLVHLRVQDQQAAEAHAKERRSLLQKSGNPLDIALIQVCVQLEGLWVYGLNGGMGDFTILSQNSDLIYVDRNRTEAARLYGPTDPRWVPPPYGFPALLSGRLFQVGDGAGSTPNPAGTIWLRLKASRHLAVLWREHSSSYTRRYEAFLMPGEDVRHRTFNYLAVHAMHFIADGQSYEAIVGDLLAFYGNVQLPPIQADSLSLLQKRLFDCLDAADFRSSPQMCSLRGSQWKCHKRGYSHILGFRKSVLSALREAAHVFAVPFDATLLALAAIAVANAKEVDFLEFTLYAPLRDGVGEAGLCGLFADWRVLSIQLDKETSTVLGVVQQVGHKIRTRQWGVYNALRKPEATMVNFQLMDSAEPSQRAGFVQIGEELWRIGECMTDEKRTDEQLPRVPQPLSFAPRQT